MHTSKWSGLIRLTRPANLPTAAADILAGIALAGGYPFHEVWGVSFLIAAQPIFTVCFASVLLYAGGVVLNDVFDARLDALERPERPIPSGLVSKRLAAVFGVLLLLAGIGATFTLNAYSGGISALLGLSILVYNAVAKRFAFWGPLVMGICRALNLWLGFSVAAAYLPLQYLWIPLLYILAVTAVSREEVRGATATPGWLAVISYTLVIIGIGGVTYWETGRLFWPAAFLLLLGVMIFRPLSDAMQIKTPQAVKKAVKAGVMGVVVMDAAWAAGYGPWWLPLLVLLLLPISLFLARRFSVT